MFQVTKRGCSSSSPPSSSSSSTSLTSASASSSSFWTGEKGERREKEKKEVLEEELEASVKAAREDVAEREDGVEELELEAGDVFWRREMIGRRKSERDTGCAGRSSSKSSSLNARFWPGSR